MDSKEMLRQYLDRTYRSDEDIVYVSVGGDLVFIPNNRDEKIRFFHLTEY